MYKLLAENINDVIWVYNVSIDKLTYISPSVLRLRGFTVEEALKEILLESLSPESAKIVSKLLPERLAEFIQDPSKHQYFINELQQKCKDGSLVWIEVTTQFQTAANGDIEILGVSRIIQKRKEAEYEFKQKSEELERFFSLPWIYYASLIPTAIFISSTKHGNIPSDIILKISAMPAFSILYTRMMSKKRWKPCLFSLLGAGIKF